MKHFLGVAALAIGIAVAVPAPARAENYFGKIDLVQVTSNGTRFFIRTQGLSLYATGGYRDVLLQVFFKKSSVSLAFSPITCPAGITGRCGKVDFVSVDVSNF